MTSRWAHINEAVPSSTGRQHLHPIPPHPTPPCYSPSSSSFFRLVGPDFWLLLLLFVFFFPSPLVSWFWRRASFLTWKKQRTNWLSIRTCLSQTTTTGSQWGTLTHHPRDKMAANSQIFFRCIFMTEMFSSILIKTSLKFVPKGLINNKPALL